MNARVILVFSVTITDLNNNVLDRIHIRRSTWPVHKNNSYLLRRTGLEQKNIRGRTLLFIKTCHHLWHQRNMSQRVLSLTLVSAVTAVANTNAGPYLHIHTSKPVILDNTRDRVPLIWHVQYLSPSILDIHTEFWLISESTGVQWCSCYFAINVAERRLAV